MLLVYPPWPVLGSAVGSRGMLLMAANASLQLLPEAGATKRA